MLPLSAILVQKIGARRLSIYSGWILSFSLIPVALSPNWEILALVMILCGASFSVYNFSINALASNLEVRLGTSKMSTIHSWFGVGNLSGAALGALASSTGVSPVIHFSLLSLLMAAIILNAYRFIPDKHMYESNEPTKFYIPEFAILVLGFILFLAATTEASTMNWVALFYTDFLNTSEGVAAFGYLIYAFALLFMRFMGDRLRNRFGAKNVIAVGCLVSATGIGVAIAAVNVWISSIGFFMLGGGIAVIFPFIFSVAAKQSSHALATVMILGAIGEMLSQPVMGYVVHHFQLDGGFIFIALVVLMMGLISWNAKLLKERLFS